MTATHDKGMAVLLALVAVGAAIVLGLALSSTRDQTVATGDSIVRASAARAASAGSLDLACALVDRFGVSGSIQSSASGASGELSTRLFDPITIGLVTYDAQMLDLRTGLGVTMDTIAVRILARSVVGDVVQSSSAVGRLVQHDTVVRADLDLSEFALLATSDQPGSVVFDPNASLGVWQATELSRLREPVLIGSSRLDQDAVQAAPGARLLGYAVLREDSFPANDADLDAALANKVFPIPHVIHVPEAPRPGRSAYAYEFDLATQSPSDLVRILEPSGSNSGMPEEYRGNINVVGDLTLAPSTVGAYSVSVTPVPEAAEWRQIDISGDLTIGGGFTLAFATPTVLVVRGNLILEEGASILASTTQQPLFAGGSINPGTTFGAAPLTIVVFGGFQASPDSNIAIDTGTSGSDPATNYPTGGVAGLIIYGTMDKQMGGDPMAPEPVSAPFVFSGARVQAQVYAPSRDVSFINGAELYGRALGETIHFGADSSLHYDPALNEGRGWSNPVSGVWENATTPRAEVLAVADLSDVAVSLGTGETTPGSGSSVEPGGPLVAIDPPAGALVVPAHAAFVGGTATGYAEEVERIVEELDPPHSGFEGPEIIRIGGILRDFNERKAPLGHPDFDAAVKDKKVFVNIAQNELSGDKRPVLGNPAAKSVRYTRLVGSEVEEINASLYDPAIDSAEPIDNPGESSSPVRDSASFAAWFTERPGVNLSVPVPLVVQRQGNGSNAQYRLEISPWVNPGVNPNPAKGRLFGDVQQIEPKTGKKIANDSFTLEIALQFRRDRSNSPDERDDQAFAVKGNGDCWVYLDGVKVAEYTTSAGRPHAGQTTFLRRTGAEDAKVSELRIFYAQRGSEDPIFVFQSNFPVWTPEGFIDPTDYTPPDRASTVIRDVTQRVVAAKTSGQYLDVKTTFGGRTGNWGRKIGTPASGGGGEDDPEDGFNRPPH